MQRFNPDEIATVIKAADSRLVAGARIIVIGGTAIGFLADWARSTTDLDVLSGVAVEVLIAFEEAVKQTGINLPLQQVGISSAPEGLMERLLPAPIQGLRHLEVLIPEPHDLALMKLVRGAEHDIEAIELLHSRHPLDPDLLLVRFHETLIIGSPAMFKAGYLVLVESLFGRAVADAHERALERA